MNTPTTSDKARLQETAKAVLEQLRGQLRGRPISLQRTESLVTVPRNTAGWYVEIGKVTKGDARLQLWLDRYSGHSKRKFYAGFCSPNAATIERMVRQAPGDWEIGAVNDADIICVRKIFAFKKQLPAEEFNRPKVENYPKWGEHYFGFYDLTVPSGGLIDSDFCERAVGFFLDVLGEPSGGDNAIEQEQDYPRQENRDLVRKHVALERRRNRYLAAERKRRDNYECQICGMKFVKHYGSPLGDGFAEAHHRVPLSELPDFVETHIDDLITVCANCHRILHRMDGKTGNIAKLKAIVRKHRA